MKSSNSEKVVRTPLIVRVRTPLAIKVLYIFAIFGCSVSQSRTVLDQADWPHPGEGQTGHAHQKREVGRRPHHSPPKYMLDLYRKLKSGEESLQSWETYRGILPTSGVGGLYVSFSDGADIPPPTAQQRSTPAEPSLSTCGQLVSAELHIRTRGHKKTSSQGVQWTEGGQGPEGREGEVLERFGNKTVRLQLTPEFRTFVRVEADETSLPLHSSSYPGWKRFDVTELLQKYCSQPWTLHLRFENTEGELIVPRKLLRLSQSPFLLLRSNQTSDFETDFAHNSLPSPQRVKRYVEISADVSPPKEQQQPPHPNDVYAFDLLHLDNKPSWKTTENLAVKKEKNRGERRKVGTEILERRKMENEGVERKRMENEGLERKRMENEVLDLYDDSDDEEDVLDLDYEEDDLSEHEADQYRLKLENSDYLPLPPRRRGRPAEKRPPTKPKKNKKEKKKKNKEDNSVLPGIWKTLSHQVDQSSLTSTGDECGLRQYKVDLREVGYGKRIISPKKYEANYCAGTCQFPLKKSVSPTNHATVLSILSRTKGEGGGLPAPCCVPKKMDSLTLLYFDSDGSVVLKTYSQMSVQSCGCR